MLTSYKEFSEDSGICSHSSALYLQPAVQNLGR